ncbi:MAG: cyclase family protein [Clostridia bacterium]|nr:cyclase family protein [Clostridia bacterium]
MRIYDVSMLIHHDMEVYKNKNEKKPVLTFLKTFPQDGYNESSILMDIHTGTHIDAPFHMINQGDTIEKINLENLITTCYVLDMTFCSGKITKDDLLKKKIRAQSFILLKTGNSYESEFNSEFVYLDSSGAAYLSSLSLKGIGIDGLGIERAQKNHDTHHILMEKNIIIIEGLRLEEVDEGEYKMIALPLKIKGADGAPARIVLIKE